MSIPVPFYSQYECRNETLEIYASDRRGIINYCFNNFGYRNNIDYYDRESNVGIYVGSSITAGIGIEWDQTFAANSSQKLEVQCYHFAQGCMPIDNQKIMQTIIDIKKINIVPKYFVIQFIDLNRRYNNLSGTCFNDNDQQANINLFKHTFSSIESLLSKDVWCFFGCDQQQHNLPPAIIKHPNCVGWNIPMIDRAGVGHHPGPKWHKMLSQGIVKKLRTQLL
jgi:hypothetical protein